MPDPEARPWKPEELSAGVEAEFVRVLTEADVLAFAENSGDKNPLHVDEAFARASTFGERIVHGAFQVGLASAMLGMHLPGRRVLLGSIHARFPAPLYYPAEVVVRGRITAWNLENLSGQLRVTVLEKARNLPTAEITMGFTLNEPAAAEARRPPAALRREDAGRKTVLVTGAAGGIGSALCRSLSAEHAVVGIVGRHGLPENVDKAWVSEVSLDLASDGWDRMLAEYLGGRKVHAVVHAAWPGIPRGGLLETEDEVIRRQIEFGTTCLIRLGRLLADHVETDGGRLVAIGSLYSAHADPHLSLAAYSLGKAALEDTVRLLAPELARKHITVNALCPSYVPVGLNRQASELQRKREAARIPMGRLCEVGDIAGAVQYLLSPAAGFVSGQMIGLTGAQL